MNDNSIIATIFKSISLSEKEISIIESKFKKQNLKKGTSLLNAGELVTNQYFVYSGCLRTYYSDKYGK